MKVLVATKQLQGERANDFCHSIEGELVTFPSSECDGEKIDGQCGCRRAMLGLDSHKATTTIAVAEMDVTIDRLRKQLSASLGSVGWGAYMSDEELQRAIDVTIDDIVHVAGRYAVGTVLERRGSIIRKRPEEGKEDEATI